MRMDFDDDIEQTLKDLDDLETDLFRDSLKKVPESKVSDEKHASPKKQASKVLPKETDDDFDDDDIADLLSDDDDIFTKSKVKKAVHDVADEIKKIEKKPPLPPTRSFDSLDDSATTKGSPAHVFGGGRGDELGQKTKDLFDKDSYLGLSDFEKGLNVSDGRKHSTFQEDVISQKKVHSAKDDLDFLTNKAGDLSGESSAQTMQVQKKKDEVNFDDSELLDDLGLDDPTAKPSKVKTNPHVSEKKGSFMDDLFGSSKKEKNIPTRKQQEFALDDKYKSSEKKGDADEFSFGGYVPSSAAASGPTSRRKSVKSGTSFLEITYW